MRLKMQVDSAKSYGIMNSEKYSRGRRGAPAKGVGRATGARVQIPPSAFDAKASGTLKTEQYVKP